MLKKQPAKPCSTNRLTKLFDGINDGIKTIMSDLLPYKSISYAPISIPVAGTKQPSKQARYHPEARMFPGVAGFLLSEGVYVMHCHAAIRTVLFAPGSTEKKGGCHGHGLDRMPKPFAVVWARVVLEARGCLAVSGQKDPARVGVKKMGVQRLTSRWL